jgi:hypothetical protein
MPPSAGTDPLELVALAQRLGIPADDAIQLVVQHLDHRAVGESTPPLGSAVETAKLHRRRRGARRRKRADDLHGGAETHARREKGSEV